MAHVRMIKLEAPDSPPFFYPKSQAAAKIINVQDYKVVNFNYLFEHAKKTGHHRDRLPVYNPMKQSKHIDPFTGKRVEPLPPVLFDLIGQPAGWGISVADILARGTVIGQSLVSPNDNVLRGYRHIDIDITVEWPCFLHYAPFKHQFTMREGKNTRYHMAYYAAQAVVSFLQTSSKWNVDPAHRYWAPEPCRAGVVGINEYNIRLVALVNTHEQHWRCDLAIVRPINDVPRNCSPTMLDPVQYRFF